MRSPLMPLLLVMYLVPIWVFPFIPTENGPVTVYTGLILNGLQATGTRYGEFFDIRCEQLPNWTSLLLLAGMVNFVSPQIAEKILSSLYIISFVLCFRYFLRSFGSRYAIFAPMSFLFVFSRCFFSGFYNYCLSLSLLCSILGYSRRSRRGLTNGGAVVLCLMFLAAYFTHLLGFLLAISCTTWLLRHSSITCRCRFLLATMPAGVLCMMYLSKTEFFTGETLQLLHLNSCVAALDFANFNAQLFGLYEGSVPMGGLVSAFFGLLALARALWGSVNIRSGQRAFLIPALCMALLYSAVPDSLSGHGGFIKARIPPILCLLILCVIASPIAVLRWPWLRWGMVSLVCVNLLIVCMYFRNANDELREFVAGRDCIGQYKTIYVLQCRPRLRSVDYLRQAAAYYCFGTGNVSLDNYQAERSHFPIRFRGGVTRGLGAYFDYQNRDVVDIVLAWDPPPQIANEFRQQCNVVFHKNRLWLFCPKKTLTKDGS